MLQVGFPQRWAGRCWAPVPAAAGRARDARSAQRCWGGQGVLSAALSTGAALSPWGRGVVRIRTPALVLLFGSWGGTATHRALCCPQSAATLGADILGVIS